MGKLSKFENVDVIASLEAIMKQNTAFYQSDFEIDKRILREAASRPAAEEKRLLWFSRPSGTCCFRERDVFLKDTRQHNTWRFYGEQTRDKILAYAVELTGKENGIIKGNLYELDYPQHFREVVEKSLPADNYTLLYEHGERVQPAGMYFDGNPDPQLGKFERFEAQPNDPEALHFLMREEKHSYDRLKPGDFKAHITALHDSRIEAEAQRIVAEMKRQDSPNSPNKTHFMVELSPYFMQLASTKDTDRLFAMLPYKGLKPSTAAGAKRVLSVALSHARKYRYIETNAAKDTLTKFGKGDKTPDPYTPEQVKALMQRVEGTVWEMPVILGGLYGMRRSEILGLRWRNVDLENNTFDVTEQLPFKVPPKTKVIEEMAPPKSNGRKLPITELARPFFLKQLAMQEVQKEQAAKDGKPYYDNDLVVAKPDGAPIAASWVSSQFGKLLEDLDMPHIRFHDLRHTAATNMHQLTGDFYTVGEVLGHTLAGIGASLGLSMNFEAVTARYVDVRLERKKEVLDAYHSAVEKAAPEKPKEAEPKKGKRAAKKKHSEIDL